MLEPDFLAEARAALADPHFIEMVNAAKAVGPLFWDLSLEQQEAVCAALRHEPDGIYGAIAGAMAVKPAGTKSPQSGGKVPTRRRKPTLAKLLAKAKAAGATSVLVDGVEMRFGEGAVTLADDLDQELADFQERHRGCH